MYSLLHDIESNKIAILHGYRQDKDKFIVKAIELITSPEACKLEKEVLSKVSKKDRICCENYISMGFLFNCPVHEKDNLIIKCKNSIIWNMVVTCSYISKIIRFLCCHLCRG